MFRTIFALLIFSLSITSCQSQTKPDTVVHQKAVEDTISLLFVGDLMQHLSQIEAAKQGETYLYEQCFKYVTDEIKTADWAIANLEVPLGGKPYSGYPVFSSPDEFLLESNKAGFNVFLTANNHSLDKGKKGLERTIDKLKEWNIPFAGTYKNKDDKQAEYPLILDKKGIKIALLNYTYGTNGFAITPPNIINLIDTVAIAKDIEVAKTHNPDIIIACMHWGDEYVSIQNKKQESLAKWLINKGVNHVVGAHPHVPQPVKFIKNEDGSINNVIAYSLGNFISNMSLRKTDGGLMLKMNVVKKDGRITTDCTYSIVWTDRPKVSKKNNYELITLSRGYDSLSADSKRLMDRFINDTRQLMEKYSHDCKEYMPK